MIYFGKNSRLSRGNLKGECFSKPEMMAEGKMRLPQEWECASGDSLKGKSILKEILKNESWRLD